MALNLDLSSSVAKIARANEHLKTLKGEVETIKKERCPYSARLDHYRNSGRYSLLLRSGDFKEPRLGIILGDLVHNLRSALDYIVTGLVNASPGAILTTRHQFPIFSDPGDYDAKAPAMLAGIIHGLNIIRDVQPFNQAEPKYDPLAIINFFSNADKHRTISQYQPVLGPIKPTITPGEGIIETELFAPPPQWRPNQQREIARVTYGESWPNPSKVRLKIEISVGIFFGALHIREGKQGFGAPAEFFEATSKHVAMIVDMFKAL